MPVPEPTDTAAEQPPTSADVRASAGVRVPTLLWCASCERTTDMWFGYPVWTLLSAHRSFECEDPEFREELLQLEREILEREILHGTGDREPIGLLQWAEQWPIQGNA